MWHSWFPRGLFSSLSPVQIPFFTPIGPQFPHCSSLVRNHPRPARLLPQSPFLQTGREHLPGCLLPSSSQPPLSAPCGPRAPRALGAGFISHADLCSSSPRPPQLPCSANVQRFPFPRSAVCSLHSKLPQTLSPSLVGAELASGGGRKAPRPAAERWSWEEEGRPQPGPPAEAGNSPGCLLGSQG